MKRTVWLVVIALVAVAFGAVVYGMALRGYYRAVAPPPGIGIQELSGQVGLVRIREAEREGSVFYLAEGKLPPGYVLASGPPVYVFDSSGRLVEWIEDSGDQPGRMRPWEALPSRGVSLEHVLRQVERQRGR